MVRDKIFKNDGTYDTYNNIGIVGLGFVGGAIKNSFQKHFNILSYDIDKNKSDTHSIKELCRACKFIFITLPTPINKDGSCYLNNINDILEEINMYNSTWQDPSIVIIKSSTPPGTTKAFSEKYKNIDIVFSPEFLTERNANEDFANQDRIIIGGNPLITIQVKSIFEKIFPQALICETDFNTAEMVKFTINCFLATKVSFFNEMYQVCQKLDVNYDKMVSLSLLDKRIGESHTKVPGWDGNFGFSGACFPANINIMIDCAKELDIDMKILKACWEKNLEVRPGKDWELLKKRCVR